MNLTRFGKQKTRSLRARCEVGVGQLEGDDGEGVNHGNGAHKTRASSHPGRLFSKLLTSIIYEGRLCCCQLAISYVGRATPPRPGPDFGVVTSPR